MIDNAQPDIHDVHGSLDEPPSESPASVPVPPPPPTFDMLDFMHQSSSYDIQKVLQQAEALPPNPHHGFSERPGGEARREILKSRASKVTRSVSEVLSTPQVARFLLKIPVLFWRLLEMYVQTVNSDIITYLLRLVHLQVNQLLRLLIAFLFLTGRFQAQRYTFQDDAYNE